MIKQHRFNIQTKPRQTHNITSDINALVKNSGVTVGLCHLFIHHTSASLIVTENADPDVRRDLEYFMQKMVLDNDSNYYHKDEGPDDMSAHIRTVLTQTEITIPITSGKLNLGTWQGVFCWEHRTHSYNRHITVTIQGE